MISYDDIVKAGSNIGGWEGKRGFYAVERYYEMAEKLRVQGYVRRAPQGPPRFACPGVPRALCPS